MRHSVGPLRSNYFCPSAGTAGGGVDKEGRLAAWTEAFDEYKNGNTKQAKASLRSYLSQFGETKSNRRLLNLLSETPPQHCTIRYSDDAFLDDDLM